MAVKFRDILLKSIPYLLSIAGGLTLFILTKDNIRNENVADLINNIAASLLSIPLVFLLYDYSNYRISRQLTKTLADNMEDKINVVMLNLTILVRQMIGARGKLTFETLNKMGDLRVSQIAPRLKMGANALAALRNYHSDLESLIYNSAKSNILSIEQVQTLAGLSREVLHLINGYNYHNGKKVSAKHIQNIVLHIIDWFDSDAAGAMHFQQLLGTAGVDDIVSAKDGKNTAAVQKIQK